MAEPFFGRLQNIDEKIQDNPKAVQAAMAEGELSPSALNGSPSGVKRLASKGGSQKGITPLGTGADLTKTFTISTNLKVFVPDTHYSPDDTEISGNATKNVTLAKFFGPGDKNVSQYFATQMALEAEKDFTNNLYLQAEIFRAVSTRAEFKDYKFEVEEGLYHYEKNETRKEGAISDLRSKGQAIAYTIRGSDVGNSNFKIFKVAEYLANYPFYDKLILDWNTYYSADVTGRLFVIVPDCSDGFDVSWGRQTETRFNGVTQSSSLALLNSEIRSNSA